MKLHYLYLFFTITWSIHAEPLITDFNSNSDSEQVETLVKAEWPKLFLQPKYDQMVINKMFYHRHPGNIVYQEKILTIKILRDNDKVAGFITYYQPNLTTGSIELLAIDKEYRGKGYGKKLIEYVINECTAKGLEKVQLYVYPTNQHALAIYKHLGFYIECNQANSILLTLKLNEKV